MTSTVGPLPPRNRNQEEERGGKEVGGRITDARREELGPAGGGGAEVGLRGVAVAMDTREHARRRLSEGVDRGILAAKVEEIVREVVRGVRTPIRESEVRCASDVVRFTLWNGRTSWQSL